MLVVTLLIGNVMFSSGDAMQHPFLPEYDVQDYCGIFGCRPGLMCIRGRCVRTYLHRGAELGNLVTGQNVHSRQNVPG